MFTVGEFSRIAQVSKRLLRYYDEIGLLPPRHIDPSTGYRFYSAGQLPQLNRILALKDLGLSLEQIQRLARDEVSMEEMQGMLLLKKAEIEQHLQGELHRIRKIEARLQAICNAESNKPLDVVLKRVPSQPVMSTRMIVEDFAVTLDMFDRIERALPPANTYGWRFCICYYDGLVERDTDVNGGYSIDCDGFVERDMDLEMGYFVDAKPDLSVSQQGPVQLQYRELPAAESMATIVVEGALEHIQTGYMEIGTWAELNGYRLDGVPREITLQVPQAADGHDLISEIQFPVKQIG